MRLLTVVVNDGLVSSRYDGILWKLLVICAVGIGVAFCSDQKERTESRDVGYLFHLTDLHLDVNYSEWGDLTRWCHGYQNGIRGANIGRFGNHNFNNVRIYCDSPMTLVRSAIEAMKAVLPDPDLIFWTGDNLPHVPDSMYDTADVVETMGNLTDLLKSTFPSVPIYPVLGNHDYWEASQFPGYSNRVYKEAADLWSEFIGYQPSMAEGGYYHIGDFRPNLSLIGLNTNLYYYKNRLNLGPDPADQLKWLAKELNKLELRGQKTIIIGHIPPGSYERRANISWFMEPYNSHFVQIISRYSDSIHLLIFGHNHLDSFRIIYDSQGKPINHILLSASVCPGRSNNPSFRVMKYDRNTFEVLDIIQYYMDLKESNFQQQALWVKEYTFKDTYRIEDETISTKVLNDLLERLKLSDEMFQRFYQFNSVSLHQDQCDSECRNTMLCTLEHLNYPQYHACLSFSSGNTADDTESIRSTITTTPCSTTPSTRKTTNLSPNSDDDDDDNDDDSIVAFFTEQFDHCKESLSSLLGGSAAADDHGGKLFNKTDYPIILISTASVLLLTIILTIFYFCSS